MKKNLHIIIISFLFSVILWISISLSNDYYVTLDVPVQLADFPSGYSTGAMSPSTVAVKLKGKGWKLIAISLSTESDFVVPVGRKVGKRSIRLSNYLNDNPWLSSDLEVSNISPDTLSFVVEKVIEKKVPVAPDLNLNFRSGYGLASKIIVEPESTVVSGPATYIATLTSVPTKELEFDDLDTRTVKRVPLKNIFGMTYDNNFVQVTLDVQKIVDKSFDNIPVHVVDVPKDRNVLLLPNRVNVGIRGGIDILGKLDTTEFNVYVNYREVVLDTLGSVVPHVDMPDNSSLIYIKPERLRYIIKKF